MWDFRVIETFWSETGDFKFVFSASRVLFHYHFYIFEHDNDQIILIFLKVKNFESIFT